MTTNEWISVEDRLPEEGLRVIAYTPTGDEDFRYRVMPGGKLFKQAATDATHWMIPEPPKGD